MTEEQLGKLLNIHRRIIVVRNLVNRDKIPVEVALREAQNFKIEPKKLYPLYDIYELPDNMNSKIREILDQAGNEVKQYLAEELKMLENKFLKIEIKNEND